MATYYSQGDGAWSTLANWDTVRLGGGSDPASVAAMDNNEFIIQAGHDIEFDVDMSGFANGIDCTIEGGATPGMVYSKYSGDGTYYLKIATTKALDGTTATNRGRLLANSDGVWGNTGALPFGRKFIIELAGTAVLTATNLDIQLYDTEPANLYVATYKTLATVSSINTGTDVITMTGAHGWVANTAVCIKSSGTLPAPLVADTVYYVSAPSGADLKLAPVSGGTAIDITSAGTGTIQIYDGHTDTGTAIMNVLTDLTADPQWVATAAAALTDQNAPSAYDQQRTTLSAVAAGTITLGANVDSTQYPGARIWLLQRNVAIRNNGTSASQVMIYAPNIGSVFQCEIRNTAGSATTFYGYGISAGSGYTLSGILSGCYAAIYGNIGTTISGIVVVHNAAVQYGSNNTISGHIVACDSAISHQTGLTLTGSVIGSTTGLLNCTDLKVSGKISGNQYSMYACTGVVTGIVLGNYADVRWHRDYISDVVFRTPNTANPPTTYGRATAYYNSYSRYCFEDYLGTIGHHKTLYNFGTVERETVVVRVGGADNSIKVLPESACSTVNFIPVFEWVEHDVPASAQTRGVYVRGLSWTTWPTAAELWFEAEFLDEASGMHKETRKSTQVLTDNTTWVKLAPTAFTPLQVGTVRYRLFLGKYEAACGIYIDNELETS